ncbi:hypothetical protein [Kineobactrum salinum]|uniref:Uncharacterized protein n=1 Tax=Kineobactrum salinum TaxID=2708301 RepID=A0A6C0U397_9GAMM|nr:hypothetical protein [Kineobactrum salinum]QIB66642.1 hypothetical protein G3T16_15835 [Kineobactrum salinum]
MQRQQLIRELRAAEAALILERKALHDCVRSRVSVLRALHPVYLLGGGFLAGVVVQRAQALLLPGLGLGSAATLGLRLWPLLSSGWQMGMGGFGSTE